MKTCWETAVWPHLHVFLDTGEIKNRDYIPRYLMFKLLQGVHGQFEPIFGGAVRHPLQHDFIRLDPVADALLHH